MINAAYGLFSAWYCPFAQRTWMALEEARLPYDYIEFDPYNKTREWLSISRGTGQVPVLEIRTQDTLVRIPDSVRTIEFLNDVGTDFKPMGKTEMERSEQRYQIDNLSKILIPYFYRFLKAEQDSQQAQHAKTQMLAGLRSFVAAMSSNGPFFGGDTLSGVDIAFAPFALRIELLLGHYKGFSLPKSGEAWERYATWWAAVKACPSFQSTMPEPETYEARLIEFYIPYSKGGGQSDVTLIA
jgi:glutathione S-transferase